MHRRGEGWWWRVLFSLGYATSIVLVGAFLSGSELTAGTAALFLLPSLAFGAVIAQAWALLLPPLLGAIVVLYDFALLCQPDCLAELVSGLRLVLLFVTLSLLGMLLGILLGRSIRHLLRSGPP